MNERFEMQGGKNWIFPKEMIANRFFWNSYWLEIWSNHFCPSMGPNGGIVAMGSVPQHMSQHMQQPPTVLLTSTNHRTSAFKQPITVPRR
jgi:hypothetical protein